VRSPAEWLARRKTPELQSLTAFKRAGDDAVFMRPRRRTLAIATANAFCALGRDCTSAHQARQSRPNAIHKERKPSSTPEAWAEMPSQAADARWNCASSVDPFSAVVEDCPCWIAWVTWSK
jgi:hypothetical protein